MYVAPFSLGFPPPSLKIRRFALNYKKIPFKLVDIPFSSIESTARSLGAPPTDRFPTTGEPKYTVPSLHDSDKNAVISDSFLIAEYLDAAYPDTPRLLLSAEDTTAVKNLIEAREEAFRILVFPVLMPKIVPLYPDELREVFVSRGV
ncbi:hypothetical protein PQX77_013370 [Marasmius sp. AFHP31]|nr:hypothetical protein PQX77_013370 [Marasmius sp. AFHP31]